MLILKNAKKIASNVTLDECERTLLVPGDIIRVHVNEAMGYKYITAERPVARNNKKVILYFPVLDMKLNITHGSQFRHFSNNYTGFQTLDLLLASTLFHLELVDDPTIPECEKHYKVCK